jgi:hypothetical protein
VAILLGSFIRSNLSSIPPKSPNKKGVYTEFSHDGGGEGAAKTRSIESLKTSRPR